MGMRMLLAATFLVVLSQASAWSGRAVTNEEERMKLAAALTAEGCSGGEVEFDKGKYEVEAAMCRDGKEYDLVFDANFKLLGRELDD
jgi:Peptidase propeptide and YPEB domain